jgi:hypothetical protein
MSVYQKIDPREENLPKWVQENLNSLRLRVSSLEETVKDMESGTTANNFWFESLDGGKYYMPKHSRLMFSQGSRHSTIDIGFRESWPGLYLNGYESLIIKPSAANSCYIKSERS